MKKKELNEWRSKNLSEVVGRAGQFQKEKVETHLKIKMGKIKNVHSANIIAKDIAQLKTIAQVKKLTDKFQKTQTKVKENGAN